MRKYGKGIWLAGMLCGALCLGGCGSSKMAETDSSMAAAEAPAEGTWASGGYGETAGTEEAKAEETAEEGNTDSVASNRKLIRTVRMNLETEEFESLMANLEQQVAFLGGYIENMNVYNGSRRNGQGERKASMTVRIPKDSLSAFIKEVSAVSNVTSKSESTEDVTLNYVDLESHKKVLQVEQERLLDLLEKADTLEDILTIEERLSQVRYELESMESRLRTYDNLVDYSTVYLSVEEVEKLTPVEERSDLAKTADGFMQSARNLFRAIKGFLMGVVICLPYLIFLAALASAVILTVKIILKKSRKREMERIDRLTEAGRKTEKTASANAGQATPEEKNPAVGKAGCEIK